MEDELLSLLFTILFGQSAQAQIANPSIFSEMKSINPAVISGRKQGQFTFIASKDELKTEQDTSALLGAGGSETNLTEMTQISVFRGGKGSGMTTEFGFKMVDGKVKSTVTNAGKENVTESEASSMGLQLNYGFSESFGIGFSLSTYKRDYTTKFEDSGTTYDLESVIDTKFFSVKPGFRFGSSAFRIGTFVEAVKQSGTMTSENFVQGKIVKDEMEPAGMSFIVGAAVGLSAGKTNLELSYEGMPMAGGDVPEGQSEADAPPKPMRLSLLIEGKAFGITLGYKGSMYKGMFMELENILSSQLLYPNPGTDARLEHTVNFSFGGDKGLSIGGSAYISNTKGEKPSSSFFGNTKYPTTEKAMGYGVKVGYVW